MAFISILFCSFSFSNDYFFVLFCFIQFSVGVQCFASAVYVVDIKVGVKNDVAGMLSSLFRISFSVCVSTISLTRAVYRYNSMDISNQENSNEIETEMRYDSVQCSVLLLLL